MENTAVPMKNIAAFDQLSNDLFWSWYHSDFSTEDHHFQKLQWTGYNDSFWWNNVSVNQSIRECSCGKKFKLDFSTNEVEEVHA